MVALGVKCYGQQNEIASEMLLETALQDPKVVRYAIAKVGQSATGVNEIQSYDFAGELRQRHAAAHLISQCEVRHARSDSQHPGIRCRTEMTEHLQTAGSQRILFNTLVGTNTNVFCVG